MNTLLTKSRISVSLSPKEELFLDRIAKRDRVPVATKARELLSLALSTEEDMHLSNIARARLSQKNIAWQENTDAVWK